MGNTPLILPVKGTLRDCNGNTLTIALSMFLHIYGQAWQIKNAIFHLPNLCINGEDKLIETPPTHTHLNTENTALKTLYTGTNVMRKRPVGGLDEERLQSVRCGHQPWPELLSSLPAGVDSPPPAPSGAA